jgi:NodT family efflux transporter outer membrane factor (OMF) lipoprotein
MNIYRYLCQFMALTTLLGSLLLSACMVGPDYKKPELPVPQSWLAAPIFENTNQQLWWQQFNDPILNHLLEKAWLGNLDIKTAEARIMQARALYASATAALFPTGDLIAVANRQGNQIGFPGGGTSNIAQLVKQPFNTFKAGFDVSWEMDLFGGHRRSAEASKAEFEAENVTRDDILISTLAEIARTYIEIRQYQNQLAIAQQIVGADNKTTELTQQLVNIGTHAGIDVTRTLAILEHDQSQIAYFKNALAQAEFRMDVLLGEKPGLCHTLVKAIAEIPSTDKTLILATPAIVMTHRPDIRHAERMLGVATAQQGVATAKFYPDISLTGFIGLFNTNAGNFLNVSSKSWTMGGNVLWPILSYGTLSANLHAADAKQQAAMTQYQHAMINAFSDVERSLTAYSEQEIVWQSLSKSNEANNHVVQLARERYDVGLSSLFEVLDAQRSFFNTQNQVTIAKAQTSINLISVYKSLGGSWLPK